MTAAELSERRLAAYRAEAEERWADAAELWSSICQSDYSLRHQYGKDLDAVLDIAEAMAAAKARKRDALAALEFERAPRPKGKT